MKTRGFEKISQCNREIIMPKRGTKYAAGYDIFNNTDNDITIKTGEISEAIPTYIKSYMLDDEVLKIYVRSGHGFKFSVKLANSTGIIDKDYYNNSTNEGHIFIKLHNQGSKDLVIPKGEAMAQAIFTKYLLADDDNMNDLDDRNGGFGSTSK